MSTRQLLCLSTFFAIVTLANLVPALQPAGTWLFSGGSGERCERELEEAQNRHRQLEDDETAVRIASAARLAAAEDWIAGRRTYAETLARLNAINASLPAWLEPPLAANAGETEQERQARWLRSAVGRVLEERPDSSRVLARLHCEASRFLNHGT